VVACCDAYVVGGAAAKRVRTDVEPAMHEIKADALHQAHPYPTLLLDRERASWGRRRRQSRLPGQGCFEQIRQERRDLIEQAVDRRNQSPRLVLVEESLVGAPLQT